MITDANDQPIVRWPADWPGQEVVDFDNLGDPGGWLETRLPYFEDALADEELDVTPAAAMLAEDYIYAASTLDFPLPSDFDVSEDDCLNMVEADFCGFLLEWRRRAKDVKACGA